MDIIVKEIGLSTYTERQIRGINVCYIASYIGLCSYLNYCIDGCRTYRKSLRGQRNGRSEAEVNRVRIRARQQRVSLILYAIFQ